jgi:hypothetical protein
MENDSRRRVGDEERKEEESISFPASNVWLLFSRLQKLNSSDSTSLQSVEPSDPTEGDYSNL